MTQVLSLPPLLSCKIREGHQWGMDPEMESFTVTPGFPDKPKPWEYWPRGVNRGALDVWGLVWVPKTTRRCPVWFYFFSQHTCTHVVLPERCWVESAGGMSSSAVVMHKRGFATTKTRCQRKPGKLDGLKLGLGERCPKQWFRAQVSFLHSPSLSRRSLLSADWKPFPGKQSKTLTLALKQTR